MTTKKIYLLRDAPLSATAVVKEVGDTEGRPWIRLDRTTFHAQGGGQKADRGRIDGVSVAHVAHGPQGAVLHYFDRNDSFAVGQTVTMSVDPEWRFTNARYHSGGHLIAALVENRFPILTAVAGHHWPGEARVEFKASTAAPSAAAIGDGLADDLKAAVVSAAPTNIVGDPYTERSIQLGSYPAVPCGGTHVADLSELGGIEVVKVRLKSGKIRVSYQMPD